MPDLIRTKDVAAELGVSESCLKTWRRNKTGPPWYRLGSGSVAYSRAEVEAWLAERRNAA